MALLYDDAQQAIQREAGRIVGAATDKQTLLGLLEAPGTIDEALWRTAREQGWTALAVPEEHGGIGLGLIEFGIVCQALGAAPSGVPFLTGSYGVVQSLLAGADGAVRDVWLPRLASGEITGAVAFAEPWSPLPAKPGVTFRNGRLSGRKPGVPCASRADCAIVLAEMDGAAVLVLADLAGLERPAIAGYDPSRCNADLHFAGTPATLLCGGAVARDILARLAVASAHEQLGGAEALLYMARDYALARNAFGQPIGAFQSVKHRIAELYGLVEIARANCIRAAALEGQPGFVRAAAAAKLSATDAYDTAARDCVQIHGAIGATWDQGLHLHMRRARSLAVEHGNSLFWEDILVEELTGVAP